MRSEERDRAEDVQEELRRPASRPGFQTISARMTSARIPRPARERERARVAHARAQLGVVDVVPAASSLGELAGPTVAHRRPSCRHAGRDEPEDEREHDPELAEREVGARCTSQSPSTSVISAPSAIMTTAIARQPVEERDLARPLRCAAPRC